MSKPSQGYMGTLQKVSTRDGKPAVVADGYRLTGTFMQRPIVGERFSMYPSDSFHGAEPIHTSTVVRTERIKRDPVTEYPEERGNVFVKITTQNSVYSLNYRRA